MENLGKVTLFLIAIISLLSVGIFGAYIALSISTLYQIPYLSTMSFIQLYGLILVINLLKYNKDKKEKDQSSYGGKMKKIFLEILEKVVSLLVFWGLAYIIYNILN